MSHGIKSNDLFHTLNQRYGKSLIKEVRSLEGKEHKLVRFKQHRVFNLRCLKENVVPKSVKLNFKQFKQLNERKIICKTHHQILNSRVRKTNRTIDKISKDIELLRSNIKTKVSSPHFKSITDVIYKSKEKLFKKVKQRQVRKFNISKSHQHTRTHQYQSTSPRNGLSTLPARIYHQVKSNYFKEVQNSLYLPQRCLSLCILQLLNKSAIDLVRTLME